MYHARFKNNHYDCGFIWGERLYNHGIKLDYCPTFSLTEKKYMFAEECSKIYEKYFPQIIQEICGIADGNKVSLKTLQTIIFSMYCFELENRCTCFAISTDDEIIFARNSDFLVNIEKSYMNCLYNLKGGYLFNANTTACVEMEDGVNEHGLAAGLTFVYPRIRKPGFNAGMLIRYILEKCKTTDEAISSLHSLPISSSQTVTLADKQGYVAVVECNPENIVVIRPEEGQMFVATANNYNSELMREYRNPDIDDWKADERYFTAVNALKNKEDEYSVDYMKSILSGRHGFMCQYERKENTDTVWSVIYDLKRKQIWRAEGNPSRRNFILDARVKGFFKC